LHDAGQSGVEGKIIPLEGKTSQRGTVLPHFLVVVVILRGILEKVADGQLLIVHSVLSNEDRTLAEVSAELEQIARYGQAILPFQEPGYESLILAE
jgi:hypothetical protein